jgi:hypothetical protein
MVARVRLLVAHKHMTAATSYAVRLCQLRRAVGHGWVQQCRVFRFTCGSNGVSSAAIMQTLAHSRPSSRRTH